jgi:hypothetical protein
MDKNTYLINLSSSARTDFGKRKFVEQSEVQRVFSTVWGLENQVNNGGFTQYFGSDDGEATNFAPTALRRIGAARCAAIVEQAIRAASAKPLPDSQQERRALIQSLSSAALKELEDLTQKFFKYPDNLTDLLFEYVSKHPEAFGPAQ